MKIGSGLDLAPGHGLLAPATEDGIIDRKVVGTVPQGNSLCFILEKQFKGVVKSLGSGDRYICVHLCNCLPVGDLGQVTSSGLRHIYN